MLLSHYLLNQYQDNPLMQAYILNREIDEIRGTLFRQTMFAEFELSTQQVLSVSGLTRLMDNNPTQRDSVILRERIVLPLIAIQQFALMNLRNQNENNKSYEARYRKLIIRCMFGIINAARNSA